MKKIRLTGKYNNCHATVDDEDYSNLIKHSWRGNSKQVQNLYAETCIKINGRWKTVGMHQLVLGKPEFDYLEIDHKNINGLDNRRHNLRWASRSQSQANVKKTNKKTSSKYKGVVWHKQAKKWRARITINRKLLSGGLFHSEWNAAERYNELALKHFGKYALLNRKEETSRPAGSS